MQYTYRINDTSGELTLAGPGKILTNRRVDAFAMAPAGRYLFFMDWDKPTTWQTDQVTGLPREVAQGAATDSDGYALAVDPRGKFLISYQISLDYGGGLAVYRIAADGKLTEVPGSPSQTFAPDPGGMIVFAPSGKFLYLTTFENRRVTMDPVSGQLTEADYLVFDDGTEEGSLSFGDDIRSMTITGR